MVPPAVWVMGLRGEFAIRQPRQRLEGGPHDHVALAGEQALLQPRRRVGLHLHHDVGARRGEAAERAGQVDGIEGRDRVDGADAQPRRPGRMDAVHRGGEAVELAEKRLRGGAGHLPRRGQPEAAPPTSRSLEPSLASSAPSWALNVD
nr:hypothetical protein [Rubrimonas cliftonensis]